MKTRFIITCIFSVLTTFCFAKPPKEIKYKTINTSLQTEKNGGILETNAADIVLKNNINYIFTSNSQGIYLLGNNPKQLYKGTYSTITAIYQKSSDSIFIAASIKKYNTIVVFHFQHKDSTLQLISASEIPSGVDEIIQMKFNQQLKLFIMGKRGGFEILDFYRLSWGELDAKIIYSTYLPERPLDFTLNKEEIFGSYENGELFNVKINNSDSNFNISNPISITLKKIKVPFSATEYFEFKDKRFLILIDHMNSSCRFFCLDSKKISQPYRIIYTPQNDTVNGMKPVIISNNTLYLLDINAQSDGKIAGSNFKMLEIKQLSEYLNPLLP